MKPITQTMWGILVFYIPLGMAKTLSLSYEMPRTQVIPIQHKKFNRHYELYIKLPEDYAKNADNSYPVIYTTDAKWQLDLLSGVTEFLMPDAILVGISWQTNLSDYADSGDRKEFASRFRDYSFTPHDKPEIQTMYQFGNAEQHLSFIRDDVISYVENHYRIAPKNSTYIGYSMGGEFGAYIAFTKPDTFNNYILGSPSVDTQSIDFLTTYQFEKNVPIDNVFISIGELEETRMQATQQLAALFNRGAEQGLAPITLTIIKNADHSSAVPDTFVSSIKWLSTRNQN